MASSSKHTFSFPMPAPSNQNITCSLLCFPSTKFSYTFACHWLPNTHDGDWHPCYDKLWMNSLWLFCFAWLFPQLFLEAPSIYSIYHLVMAAAAAAKSLQACPAVCDPIDSSPPGSPVPGILQARTLEWGAIGFSTGSARPKHLTRSRTQRASLCLAAHGLTSLWLDKSELIQVWSPLHLSSLLVILSLVGITRFCYWFQFIWHS